MNVKNWFTARSRKNTTKAISDLKKKTHPLELDVQKLNTSELLPTFYHRVVSLHM